MKYKVGDKVKLRDDLKVGRTYGNLIFVKYMDKIEGEILTVEKVFKSGNCTFIGNPFHYSPEMLEQAEGVEDICVPHKEDILYVDEASGLTEQQVEMLTKEAPLKVSKDIYSYIRQAKLNPRGSKKDELIVSGYLSQFYFTIDEVIELCQGLKAYPNIEPIEELYYIEMFIRDDSHGYLRYDEDEDRWSIGSLVAILKCKFTMQEIKDLGEEQDNDFTQFAVKVEE